MIFSRFIKFNKHQLVNNLLLQVLLILVISYSLAKFISVNLWVEYTIISHTIFELIPVFIALKIFFIVWYTYELTVTPINHVVGMGFLIIAIFLIFHIFTFPAFTTKANDLALKYILLIRYTEAIIFLMVSVKIIKNKINKWLGLLGSITISLVISILIYKFPYVIPTLFTSDGLTNFKIINEYVIVLLLFISIYKLKKQKYLIAEVTYRWLYIGLIIAIATAISFTFYKTPTNFSSTFGHILRIAFYYCLFRGIFVNALVYPYKKLEANSKNMNEILNDLPIGLITFDSNYRLTFINKRAEELLGVKLEKIAGLSDWEIVNRIYNNTAINQSLIRSLTETKDTIKNKLRSFTNCHGDNIKVHMDVYRLNNGGFLYLFDDAKKIQALENMQLQTQTILDAISNLVLVVDDNKRIIMCNKAFEKTYEIAAKDIIGMDLHKLNELTNFSNQELLNRALGGLDTSGTYEVSIVTPQGNKKYLLLQYAPIHNVAGEVIGVIGVASDITILKKEQQNIQQQEKLTVLGQMAAGIVHEVKNPLTAILGFNRLINKKTNDEEIKSYASAIEYEANSLNKIVSDFLAFAKPHPLQLERVSLNSVIESMKLIIESNAEKLGITIAYELEADLKRILIDQAQIKQVILNIVNNAFDAMETTQNPMLKISTGYNKLTHEIYISMFNNGKSMSEEEKQKIVTPFYTTKDYGIGLGLSISYQVVKEHGGRIEFDSVEGIGTSFTIIFFAK